MKISLQWLKDYIDLSETPEKISELLTSSGLEVEHLEDFEVVEGGLKGLVIGEVLSCEKHPNADKLRVTTVDIGTDSPSPIVCGAPNVGRGQKVIVATIGATLYPKGHESFKIKKAKIRGEVSEGMICAEDEIGMGESHDGIMVLDTSLPNGTPAAAYFGLSSDKVYEIGLTPNRADATSHIGVARDLKALLQRDIQWPSVRDFKVDNTDRTIQVSVEHAEACPRYVGLSLSGIKVGPSPEWMQNRLRAIGIGPINNIVDITNYVLHETGQPLHAFDADKIVGDKVFVKTLKEGTPFVTLDEKERKLNGHDLMICNSEKPMCIAGVFGGLHSGISNSTQHVFLESAYFSADSIRRTSLRHQLKTDASFRYERGTDPNILIYAVKRAALLIQEIAGGKVSSEISDTHPEAFSDFQVAMRFRNIKRLIGKEIPKEEIFTILEALDIKAVAIDEEGFTAVVPPYRVDVQREADVIEEILRIYGFDNIEIPPFVSSDMLAEFPSLNRDKEQKAITELLSAKGYYEIITNSLTKQGYAENAEHLNGDHSVLMLNPLSEDLSALRQSLLPTGLEVLAHNINRRQKDLKLFEFGKQYFLRDGKYREENRLALFLSGNHNSTHWAGPDEPNSIYHLAGMVQAILHKSSLTGFSQETVSHPYFAQCMEINIGQKNLVRLGSVAPSVAKQFDIKQDVFYADLDWDLLLKKISNDVVYYDVPKFPEVRRDLSLVIDSGTEFESIKKLAGKRGGKSLKNIHAFDVYEGDKIDEGKKAYAISFILQDEEKTLTDKAIDKTMSKLIQAFETELGAIIRK